MSMHPLIFSLIMLVASENDNLLEQLTENWDWWGAITGVYGVLNTMLVGILFAVLYLFGVGVLYIKMQDIAPVSIFMILGAVVLGPFLATPFQFFFAACAIIGVATILWRLAKK